LFDRVGNSKNAREFVVDRDVYDGSAVAPQLLGLRFQRLCFDAGCVKKSGVSQ
jgi:hypothetical protein